MHDLDLLDDDDRTLVAAGDLSPDEQQGVLAVLTLARRLILRVVYAHEGGLEEIDTDDLIAEAERDGAGPLLDLLRAERS